MASFCGLILDDHLSSVYCYSYFPCIGDSQKLLESSTNRKLEDVLILIIWTTCDRPLDGAGTIDG